MNGAGKIEGPEGPRAEIAGKLPEGKTEGDDDEGGHADKRRSATPTNSS